jgi:hypothetical protein
MSRQLMRSEGRFLRKSGSVWNARGFDAALLLPVTVCTMSSGGAALSLIGIDYSLRLFLRAGASDNFRLAVRRFALCNELP